MRLIDADNLKDLEEMEYIYFKSPAAVPFYEAHKVWETIDNAPTIDAMPLEQYKSQAIEIIKSLEVLLGCTGVGVACRMLERMGSAEELKLPSFEPYLAPAEHQNSLWHRTPNE